MRSAASAGCKQIINKPITCCSNSKTLIDHVYTNNPNIKETDLVYPMIIDRETIGTAK